MEERVIDLEGGVRVHGLAISDLRAELAVAMQAISELRAELRAVQTITLWLGRVYAWIQSSARRFPWH